MLKREEDYVPTEKKARREPDNAYIDVDAEDDDDDDVVILGTSNEQPTFAHARSDCKKHPHNLYASSIATKHCEMCYCYVCDVKVCECASWEVHCLASSASPEWQRTRQRAKAKREKRESTEAKRASAPPPAPSTLRSGCACLYCAAFESWLRDAAAACELHVLCGVTDRTCVQKSAEQEPGVAAYESVAPGREPSLRVVRRAATNGVVVQLLAPRAVQPKARRRGDYGFGLEGLYGGMYEDSEDEEMYGMYGRGYGDSDDELLSSDEEDSDEERDELTGERKPRLEPVQFRRQARACSTCGLLAEDMSTRCGVCGVALRRAAAVAVVRSTALGPCSYDRLGSVTCSLEVAVYDPRQSGSPYEKAWAAHPEWPAWDASEDAEHFFFETFLDGRRTVRALCDWVCAARTAGAATQYVPARVRVAAGDAGCAALARLVDEAPDVLERVSAIFDVRHQASMDDPKTAAAAAAAAVNPEAADCGTSSRDRAVQVVGCRGSFTVVAFAKHAAYKPPAGDRVPAGRGNKKRPAMLARRPCLWLVSKLLAEDRARWDAEEHEELSKTSHHAGSAWGAPSTVPASCARFRSSAGRRAGGWASTDTSLSALRAGARKERARMSLSLSQKIKSIQGLMTDLENLGHAEYCAEPEGLSVRLLPFQRQSVRWILDQELLPGGINSHLWAELPDKSRWFSPALEAFRKEAPTDVRGGVLAEEMGMGKTVMTCAAILGNPPPAQFADDDDAAVQLRRLTWGQQVTAGDVLARGTLVVCPVSLVGQWVSEAEEKMSAPGCAAPRVYKYYGSSRVTDAAKLAEFDIVVTTYAVLASDLKARTKAAKLATLAGGYVPPLQRLVWWRVVLDESHTIKSAGTVQSQACRALRSNRRWAVTGTPCNTSLSDLAAQLDFLQVSPLGEGKLFAEQFAGRVERSVDGDGFPSEVLSFLRRIIMRHSKQMQVLDTRDDALNSTPLRRLLELPTITERVVEVVMSAKERAAYAQLERAVQLRCLEIEQRGDAAVRKATFECHSVLRPLRQACSGGHIAAGIAPRKGGDDEDEAADDDLVKAESSQTKTRRGANAAAVVVKPETLPDEDEDGDEDYTSGAVSSESAGTGLVMQSKLDALCAGLERIRDDDEVAKTLVFSQFGPTLAFLMEELPKRGFQFRTLTGDMSMAKRAKALRDFQEDPPTTIFLLSIRAGACGINLTQANHVFLCEPCTNPALSAQAIGRVHRMGQTREVTIHHLICKDTVETRIRHLFYDAQPPTPAVAEKTADAVLTDATNVDDNGDTGDGDTGDQKPPAAGATTKKPPAVAVLAGSVMSDNAKIDFGKFKTLVGL